MKIGEKQDWKLIRFFLAGFLVVFLLSCVAIFLIENQMSTFARKEIQTNESRVVQLENELLSKEIGGILGDLHYLHHIYETALANPEGHAEISTHWTEFSLHRGIYDQIRYIDSLGDERIRINFDGIKAYAVETQSLQNKADRYYFRETAKLPSGIVYVSPMDLNIENNEVEQPLKPMIRFSVPLYQEDNSFSGILILNYLAGGVLAEFKKLAQTGNGYVALLNYDGYWLSCENQDNEWNFMYEDRKDQTFGALYPEEWAMIRNGPVSLCFMDINGLKQVNDFLGHDLGDELILTASRIMSQTVRKEDLAIRLGGDEFLIVFQGLDPAQSEKIWGRIVQKFEQINREESRKYLVSVSHGIVERKDYRTSEMDELVRLADEKMYQEKNEMKKALSVIRERNEYEWNY